MIDRKKYWPFKRLYLWGLGIPCLVAFAKCIGAIMSSVFLMENNWIYNFFKSKIWGISLEPLVGFALLLSGSFFIVLLYRRALFYLNQNKDIPKDDVLYFKDHIQVLGYLLTLVGFLIAILGLIQVEGSENTVNLSLIAFPIGLSLITSIYGWGLGNELMNYVEDKNILDEALIRLRGSIDSLSNGIYNTKLRYEATTEEFIATIAKMTKDQTLVNDSFNTSYQTTVKINSELQSIHQRSLDNLNTSINNLVAAYSNKISEAGKETQIVYNDLRGIVTEATAELNTSLRSNNLLIEQSAKEMVRNNNKQIKGMNNLQTEINNSVKESNSISQTNAKNMESILENIRNATVKNLSAFNSELESRDMIAANTLQLLLDIRKNVDFKLGENENEI